MSYSIGIDVGSTTLKTVVLNAEGDIIEKSYQRHLSRVREVTAEHVRSLQKILDGQMLKISVTGSAGLGVAGSAGLNFVQEVFAAAGAVNRKIPETDVVIELGGEDAKILFLRGTLEERMNGSCAGGTGAFIDQMATLMNVTVDELDELYPLHKRIYPIASRCGVFAKSDIQSLMNQGAKKEDIAASIFQAVVDQTIGGLAQGRPIKGNVLFLGGPLSFFKGLQDRFIKTLGLDEKNAVFPELAPYFMALGSAFNAEKSAEPITYDELVNQLEKAQPAEKIEIADSRPLFASAAERDEFSRRHSSVVVPDANLETYSGAAFLGIDAGSTTTKLTLIGENDEILYRHYSPNGGNPLPIIREQLQNIYAAAGDRVHIAAGAVTGYGEELVQAAFGIDCGIVETIAHFTAARHFSNDVDFIIDIGGQDIKCFYVKDGAVDSVVLNEACSAGCGSFLETFATSLGYSVAEFANVALAAKNPVNLGSRCTVFMNSSFKQAQKDGATIEDIAAGLAMSVVKNALYKVIRVRDADELGQNIVVQGGTFLNDAVLRCFETEIGRDVIRLPISELMGAYGAALFAKQNVPKVSAIISPEKLENFTHKSKATICNACANKCCLTINTFADDEKFISGNKCEKGALRQAQSKRRGQMSGAEHSLEAGGENEIGAESRLPNLVEFKYDFILNYPTYGTGRKKIGLPLVMNMYETIPFWSTFFSSLGCDVILSEPSTRELYMKGQHTISSDTICYPAKLGHGHVESLIEKGVDAIFYPCQTYNIDEGISDNCYNCPVVAYYPEVIAANIPANICKLHIGFRDKKKFTSRIFAELKPLLPGLRRGEIKLATQRAFEAYDAYSRHVAEYGEHALAYAKTHNLPVIVLACRPYHIDPEINHGIDKLLVSMGFVVVTEDAVAHLVTKQNLGVLNQWTYHARLYNAAKFVTKNENTELVQLVSFGCGIDAITTDEVSAILRNSGKLYTQIKIDEIKNLAAAKIRLRSLQAVMMRPGRTAETSQSAAHELVH
ncbi:MAG: acyl-CoA dehydratase activase [Defluviitaleaceae bacterium]|nr:acyl-CoA dehydratase activase [Defluviitaleaceae bacterium]